MTNDVQLSALLCARLCHDLVGPISAIGNGVEFLNDADAEMRGQAAELLAQSAGQAAHRLQFYRLAFGRLDGRQVSPDDVAPAARDFFADRKIALAWPAFAGCPPEAPARSALKLLLNMALLASEALVRGGSLEIAAGPRSFLVRADGPATELEAPLREALAQGLAGDESALDELAPRAVQAYLTARLAARSGARLSLSSVGARPLELVAAFP